MRLHWGCSAWAHGPNPLLTFRPNLIKAMSGVKQLPVVTFAFLSYKLLPSKYHTSHIRGSVQKQHGAASIFNLTGCAALQMAL